MTDEDYEKGKRDLIKTLDIARLLKDIGQKKEWCKGARRELNKLINQLLRK